MALPDDPSRLPFSGTAKRKNYQRINAVKIGTGNGRSGRKKTCRTCGTVHKFKVCPFCHGRA